MITNLRESVRENLKNLNAEALAYVEEKDVTRLKEIKEIAYNYEIVFLPFKEDDYELYSAAIALIKNVKAVIQHIELPENSIYKNDLMLYYIENDSQEHETFGKEQINEELEFTFKLFR